MPVQRKFALQSHIHWLHADVKDESNLGKDFDGFILCLAVKLKVLSYALVLVTGRFLVWQEDGS